MFKCSGAVSDYRRIKVFLFTGVILFLPIDLISKKEKFWSATIKRQPIQYPFTIRAMKRIVAGFGLNESVHVFMC